MPSLDGCLFYELINTSVTTTTACYTACPDGTHEDATVTGTKCVSTCPVHTFLFN